MQSSYKHIKLSVDGHVVEVTLNRPEKLNAITLELHTELCAAFNSIAANGDVRAVVLASTGKAFSAGGDCDGILADQADPARRHRTSLLARPLFVAVADCPYPVITALHGDVVGLGTTLMLCSDAVVAARSVKISDPHIVIGLAAGDGGCVVWPQATGLLRAKRYLLTGDRINAEAALAMGLVTDLVNDPAEVQPAAHALAARIAALPPRAVQATKRILNQGLRHRIEETFDYGLALEIDTMGTQDVVEAISAFKEKRPPKYRGF